VPTPVFPSVPLAGWRYPAVSNHSATFAEITSAQGERNVQFALKFYF
jgi:hypothetical protein